MKHNKPTKKLDFKKATVAHLTSDEMSVARGGGTGIACIFWVYQQLSIYGCVENQD
jgi:hypothetical protein